MGRTTGGDRKPKIICRSTFEITGQFLVVVVVRRAKPQRRIMTAQNSIAIFSERCRTMAARVRDKQIPFIEAVDFVYSAADFAGLIDGYGDDRIQTIIADAFMGARNA